MKKFLIIGGDLRQVHMANALSKGFKVYAMGFDNTALLLPLVTGLNINVKPLDEIDYIVLPLPFSTDNEFINAPFYDGRINLCILKDLLCSDTIVLAGRVTPALTRVCGKNTVIDYMTREELAVLNAVPTVEGAIEIAMSELPTTIFGQSCLITGYGRISKVLIKALTGLGADITVAARKQSDLAWAKIMGCKAVLIGELDDNLSGFGLIINTVPSRIFGRELLSRISGDCLILDLASSPGGVDLTAADELSLKAIWALSLPGKVAPVTSGDIIKETILNIIHEHKNTPQRREVE